jgi:hypothetical protein
VGEWLLNGGLLSGEWERLLAEIGREPIGVEVIGLLTLMSLLLGIFATWLHLALMPYLGGRWRAALVAGVCVWFLAYGMGFGWSYVMGIYSSAIYLSTLAWALLEVPLGTLVGAWVHGRLSGATGSRTLADVGTQLRAP